jgi:hypothetical protein
MHDTELMQNIGRRCIYHIMQVTGAVLLLLLMLAFSIPQNYVH